MVSGLLSRLQDGTLDTVDSANQDMFQVTKDIASSAALGRYSSHGRVCNINDDDIICRLAAIETVEPFLHDSSCNPVTSLLRRRRC